MAPDTDGQEEHPPLGENAPGRRLGRPGALPVWFWVQVSRRLPVPGIKSVQQPRQFRRGLFVDHMAGSGKRRA